jgi:hypothetical protein
MELYKIRRFIEPTLLKNEIVTKFKDYLNAVGNKYYLYNVVFQNFIDSDLMSVRC